MESRLEKQLRSYLQLSERLAVLGIMGAQLGATLKALGPSQHYRIERFKGVPNWTPSCREATISRTAYIIFVSLT